MCLLLMFESWEKYKSSGTNQDAAVFREMAFEIYLWRWSFENAMKFEKIR